LLANPDELYRLAYQNWRKFHAVFGTDQQLWARTRLIASQLALSAQLVTLPSPAISILDVKARKGGRIAGLEAEVVRLTKAYQHLETHYLALEGDRTRLQQLVRGNTRKQGFRLWPLNRHFKSSRRHAAEV
jgi:hypothetical protein